MSWNAKEFNGKSQLRDRALVADAGKEIQEYQNSDADYNLQYFQGFTQVPGWRKSRDLYIEVPLHYCDQALIDKIVSYFDEEGDYKFYLLEHDIFPDFDDMSSLTVGFAFGASEVNFLLWNGVERWYINEVLES